MTIFALLGWQVLGVVFAAAIAAIWRARGLRVGWGIIPGGVGGVVGGLIARTVLPAGTLFDALSMACAALGAVGAMFIVRASIVRERSGTA